MASRAIRFIDLFCGIGGFRVAADRLGWRCVFSSDIDPPARRAYAANFGEEPFGDVAMAHADDVPAPRTLRACGSGKDCRNLPDVLDKY